MRSLDQKFTIHPVGQGLFYSGIIKYPSLVGFRMVFDCGSMSGEDALEEIELFRKNFKNDNTLELLVISHFDADHVNMLEKLLADKVRIKRLVMPFLNFTDRLFLALKHRGRIRKFGDGDDFTTNIMLSPLEALRDNLDDDSEIYIIESSPESPIAPTDLQSERSEVLKDQEVLQFGFDIREKASSSDLKEMAIPTTGKSVVYRVRDHNVGMLRSFSDAKLMEFIFYRRLISKDEEEFYKKVEELFYKDFGVDTSAPLEQIIQSVVNILKRRIKSAKVIKDIFSRAKRELKTEVRRGLRIEDLNTTALCLLHRNLKPLSSRLYGSSGRINRFISSRPSRIETVDRTYVSRLFRGRKYEWPHFPNTLLTSDTYLRTEGQVEEFLWKYRDYWGYFFLFQIPHHGSTRNADQLILSQLPGYATSFINYGIGNRHKHPSSELISDLVATGLSWRTVSVNQYLGYWFQCTSVL